MIKAAYRDYHLFRLDVLLEPDSEVIPYTVHLCEPVLLTKFSEGSVSPGHCSDSNKTEVWSSSRGFHCTASTVHSLSATVLHPKTIHSPGPWLPCIGLQCFPICLRGVPRLFHRVQAIQESTAVEMVISKLLMTRIQVAVCCRQGQPRYKSDMRKLHMSKFYSKILTPTVGHSKMAMLWHV